MLPRCTRTSHPSLFKWKPPDFPALPSSSLSLLTLLHSSSSQLSFPAGCLGTASPSSSRRPSSSHSSHPSLTFVCEPPASGFPSHTRTHTSALPALSSTFFFLSLHTIILCSDTIPHQTETLPAANFLLFKNAAGHGAEFLGLIFKHISSRQQNYTRPCNR